MESDSIAAQAQANLINLAYSAMIVRSTDSRILFWNREAENLYGWTQDQAVGQVVHTLLHTRFPESLAEVNRALREVGRWEGNLWHKRRDGSSVLVHSRQALQRDKDGRPSAILEVNLDITQHAHRDEEIRVLNRELEQRVQERTAELEAHSREINRQQSQLLDSILTTMPVIMWRLNEDGIFTEARGAGLQKLHLAPDQLVGRNVRDAFPEMAEGAHAALTGGDRRYPSTIVIDGETVYFDNWVYFDAVEGQGVVGFAIDITEQKHTEASLRSAMQAVEQVRTELEERVRERTSSLARREIELAVANEALTESQQQLRRLTRRLVEVQEQERQAVANELHNDAGQLLASLMVGLGILERRYRGSESALAQIRYLKETADEVLVGLHTVGAALRPVSLDRLGLGPALRQCIESFSDEHGVAVQAVLEPGTARPEPGVALALYRVTQEALANIARHAGAQSAGVVLTQREGNLTLIIEDDGVGFDPGEGMRRSSLGLLSMRERVETVGGRLTIESAPGAGTTIIVDVPCPATGSASSE